MPTEKRKLSRAEICRNYRERKKAENPEDYFQKERERWWKRRAAKTVKTIADCSEREKRNVRRNWRNRSAKSRALRKRLQVNSPPQTPSDNEDGRRTRGRKKMKKERSKSYRMIVKLKSQLEAATRTIERYKKKLQRGQQLTGPICCSATSSSAVTATPELTSRSPAALQSSSSITPRSKTKLMLKNVTVPPLVRKSLLFHHALVDEIVQTQNNASTEKEKRMTSKMFRGNVLKRCKLLIHAKRAGIHTASKSIRENDLDMNQNNRKRRSDVVDDETKQLIIQFFERDDNSRVTTGRKETVTKQKVKKQRRIMLDTMINLHEKYCAESIDNAVSYSTFTRLRPFWIMAARPKDRETCLCQKHENIQLKIEKLFSLKLISSKNAESLLQTVCCDVNNKGCMYRDCSQCGEKSIEFSQSHSSDDDVVVWAEWVTESDTYEKGTEIKPVKRTIKKTQRGTVHELKSKLVSDMATFSTHVFNIRHQFRAYRHLKETLAHDEIVVHIDFSENWSCKYASEIQKMHFGASQRQATIHTGVAYSSGSYVSFATISDVLNHGPSAIWASLKPVLSDLKAANSDINAVHFFSDGPTTQYRNKLNFFLWSTLIFDMGFEYSTWNFFEAGHGKGAPDAVGGTLKRRADTLVLNGRDIPTAHDLFAALKTDSSVRLYYIDEDSVNAVNAVCTKSLKPVAGTMKIHQLWTIGKGYFAHRKLSCFCCRPTQCACYEVAITKFPASQTADFDNCEFTQHLSTEDITPAPIVMDENEVNSTSTMTEVHLASHGDERESQTPDGQCGSEYYSFRW